MRLTLLNRPLQRGRFILATSTPLSAAQDILAQQERWRQHCRAGASVCCEPGRALQQPNSTKRTLTTGEYLLLVGLIRQDNCLLQVRYIEPGVKDLCQFV